MRAAGRTVIAACALLAIGSPQAAVARQPSVIGTWQWTHQANNCEEQYVFRGDGTVTITQGDKRTENTYLMSWAAEPTGRYKVTITTVKDNGGSDCSGSGSDRTGKQTVVYLLFGQSGDAMIQCGSPTGADCTGLIRRTAR